MQPYLFPYLGYFQLIHAVEAFVIYDDVNYIKGGWINRNYILANGTKQLITLPLRGASQNKLINQVQVGEQHKILKSLQHNYRKAMYFDTVYPILEDILSQKEPNLARFLDYQLRRICEYFDLHPKWYISSAIVKDIGLHGQEKIISICAKLETTHYINALGGTNLYDPLMFKKQGLKISFVQPTAVRYRQFGSGFVPNLSVIDVMMFNEREQCKRLLEEYGLV